jgi:hypothetical protein
MYLLLLEHLISIGNIVLFRVLLLLLLLFYFFIFLMPSELLTDHCEVILYVTGYWPQSYISTSH